MPENFRKEKERGEEICNSSCSRITSLTFSSAVSTYNTIANLTNLSMYKDIFNNIFDHISVP